MSGGAGPAAGPVAGLSFVCPHDRTVLDAAPEALACPACGTRYPLVRGIPVLIDDERSVFRVADYVGAGGYEGASYGSAADRTGGLRRAYRKAVSTLTESSVPVASLSAQEAARRIAAEHPHGRLLVIGAGARQAFDHPAVVYTDVAFGGPISCICDAHDLPFPDGSFAGVLAVAVLEHVVDPSRCVEEIRRVLAPEGLVYAVTPFLQPVHMGAYDFTRFTYLGHRRLFRHFDDLASGCALGPAASLAYLLPHVLSSASDARAWRRIAKLAGILLGWPVKQLDRLLGRRVGAYDAAAGVFFFGRKRAAPIADRDLLALYRGGG